MMKTKAIVLFIIIFVCYPFHAFAEEIYEETKTYVNHEEDTAHGDTITSTDQLSIPKEMISSIDINTHGEILICYENKIIVFNNEYVPIKAFDIKWSRGTFPSAVWNLESGRIVYIRDGGYEIDNNGKIVIRYEEIEDTDYRPKYAEAEGVIYKLENRVPLPNFTNTYSTVVSIDSEGNKTVLHNAIWSQFYLQFSWVVLIIGFIGIGINVIVREYRKSKMKKDEFN